MPNIMSDWPAVVLMDDQPTSSSKAQKHTRKHKQKLLENLGDYIHLHFQLNSFLNITASGILTIQMKVLLSILSAIIVLV